MSLNKDYCYMLRVADHLYPVRLHFKITKNYLSEYIVSEEIHSGSEIAEVSEEDFKANMDYLINLSENIQISSSFNEYQTLALPLYSQVIKDGIIPLHGVSVLINKDQAAVFTAPSGTGKTTQYLNWLKISPESIDIINGDNSLISTENSVFQVYSAPWAGKENYHSKSTGILNTVVCLEQGRFNQISDMTTIEKVNFLFPQVLVQTKSEDDVQNVCSALSALIKSANIVKFVNDGTVESTKILKEYIYARLEN